MRLAAEHGVPVDFPNERPKKRMRRCDDGEGEDICLDGMGHMGRMKVETFIAVADEVNQQMTSGFAEQQVKFMAELWYFTPLGLNVQTQVRTADVAELCDM